jgi:hypothetical protein
MNILKKYPLAYLALIAVAFLSPCLARAQAPTSQEIDFDLFFSHLPFGSTQNITAQVWDSPGDGYREHLIFAEAHDVKIGFFGEVDLLLGSVTPIPAGTFPAGSSRYLDVVLTSTGKSILPHGRKPFYANAFALTGAVGPAGPKGDKGDTGPQGLQGLMGLQGFQGVPGSTGATGPQGVQLPVVFVGTGTALSGGFLGMGGSFASLGAFALNDSKSSCLRSDCVYRGFLTFSQPETVV